MNLGLWFHRLIHPHCQECKDEIAENRICESCETLKMQLAIANAEKRAMLESLLEKPKVGDVITRSANLEEMKPKQMTWNVRRQMLEAEDRKAAELLRQKAPQAERSRIDNFVNPSPIPGYLSQDESISKLEKELGVEETDAK